MRPVVEALVQILRTPLSESDRNLLPIVDARTIGAELQRLPESDTARRMESLPWAADIWRALERFWSSAVDESPVLVHGDYHAGNILWQDAAVSGVIDWSDAAVGAAKRDLAHLRWETILRYDLEVLDLVQRSYEHQIGHAILRGRSGT